MDEYFADILEVLARNVHDQWMAGRLAEQWTLGPVRDEVKKQHPSLVPYEDLPEAEKEYDRRTAMSTIQGLLENGYDIKKK